MTIKKLKDLVSSDNPKRRFKDLKNIDEAEGHKTERILAAEAQKEETIRVAEGQATAI
jgi:hypothetical protein